MSTRATMPKHLRKRQPGGERARFVWAFEECLRRDPDRAPSPTQINMLLEHPPPLNILAGRLSVIRRELLREHGFVKDETERWVRP